MGELLEMRARRWNGPLDLKY